MSYKISWLHYYDIYIIILNIDIIKLKSMQENTCLKFMVFFYIFQIVYVYLFFHYK